MAKKMQKPTFWCTLSGDVKIGLKVSWICLGPWTCLKRERQFSFMASIHGEQVMVHLFVFDKSTCSFSNTTWVIRYHFVWSILEDEEKRWKWDMVTISNGGTSININCFGVETRVCIIKMEHLGQIPLFLKEMPSKESLSKSKGWSLSRPFPTSRRQLGEICPNRSNEKMKKWNHRTEFLANIQTSNSLLFVYWWSLIKLNKISP